MMKGIAAYSVTTIFLVLLVAATPAFAQIEINDIDELQLIGNDPGYPLHGNYILGNDIDASATASWNSGAGFDPIGSMPEFTGTFDGQGYTITGLTINRPASDDVGLFGRAWNATIQNVQFENGTVTANRAVGMLVGRAEDTDISDCYTAGAVSGTRDVGGLVGYAEFSATITNAYNAGAVSGNRSVGGLVGMCDSSDITSCYNTGMVTGNDSSIGGLVGYASMHCTITTCYNTAAVSGTDDVGGLVGFCDSADITSCHNTGTVTGNDRTIGGLVGAASMDCTITTCYNTGAISGNRDVGGLVGMCDFSNITSCYNAGTVTGNDFSIGGLVGSAHFNATITTCYNTGAVSGNDRVGGLAGFAGIDAALTTCYNMGTVTGNSDVGGLAGYADSNSTITDCYWDTEASGVSTSPGGGEGKTTAEMVREATFTNWDFVAVWDINEGCTYPFLQALADPIVVAVPVPVSIEQAATQSDPAADTLPIVFEVVFDNPVTGFEASDVDFSASTATVAAWTIVGADGDATYTVEVTDITTSGTVVASIPADTVTNTCAGAFNLASTSVDNSVTYYAPPYATVEQAADQEDPVETLPIQFDLLFAEPVTGLESDDILVSGTATGVEVALQGSGMAYTILVWNADAGGTITVSVPAGVCNAVATGLPNLASTSVDNTVLYDTPPAVPLTAWPAAALLLAAGVALMRRRRK